MALFAALLYYDQERYWNEDAELVHLPGYGELATAAEAAGVMRGAQALQAPSTARTISVAGQSGGPQSITDGPFAETKEVLGGLLLLDVADMDEALRWATQIPAAWRGRVEVRPVAATETDDIEHVGERAKTSG